MRMALTSKVLVITGGPGMGKTTLFNSILTIMAAKGPRSPSVPHRSRCQAPDRGTGLEARPSTGCSRPTRRRAASSATPRPARLRPAGCRRDQYARCPAVRTLLKALPRAPTCCSSAMWISCPRSGRGSAARYHQLGRGAVMHLNDLPPGRREPHHHQRPPDQPRREAGPQPRELGLLLRRGGRPGDWAEKSWPWRSASPRRFGLDPGRDVQVLCPMHRGGLGARSLKSSCRRR